MTHVCLLSHTEEPALFCGDTLFNAGAGNCYNGGAPEALYHTFVTQLARLPPATRIYPGHEYMARNLEFTLDREPGNAEAARLLEAARTHAPAWSARHHPGGGAAHQHLLPPAEPAVIAGLRAKFPDLPERPDAQTVFVRLRELRNRW